MNTKSNDKREYRQSKLFQKDLLIPLSKNDRINSLQDQGYSITYDPPSDGNCQFNALTHVLSHFGIHRSVQTVREKIVGYLERNQVDNEGWPIELYVGMPFSQYLAEMASEGTYGDELMLRAASNLYNIELSIVSTLGRDARLTISPTTFHPQGTAILGHFAEGCGEHYVVLHTTVDYSVTSKSVCDKENSESSENDNEEQHEEDVDFGIAEKKEKGAVDDFDQINVADDLSSENSKVHDADVEVGNVDVVDGQINVDDIPSSENLKVDMLQRVGFSIYLLSFYLLIAIAIATTLSYTPYYTFIYSTLHFHTLSYTFIHSTLHFCTLSYTLHYTFVHFHTLYTILLYTFIHYPRFSYTLHYTFIHSTLHFHTLPYVLSYPIKKVVVVVVAVVVVVVARWCPIPPVVSTIVSWVDSIINIPLHHPSPPLTVDITAINLIKIVAFAGSPH